MEFAGSRTITAPLAVVEGILLDVRQLVQAVPDWELDDQQQVILSVSSGPVQGIYRATVFVSRPETAVYELTFDGHGENSSFCGSGRIHLEAQNQQTLIHYAGDIDVTGQLATLPPRLLLANVNAIIRRTLNGIETILWPETQSGQSDEPLPQPWIKTAVPAGLLLLAMLFLVRFLNNRK